MKLKTLLEKKGKKGLYVAVKFSNDTITRILDFCKKSNIPNALKEKDFHSTLAYSRKPVPDFKPITKIKEFGKPVKFEIWKSPPNAYKKEETHCLVMKYDSTYMHKRFNNIMSMGATYDYDEYRPHMTLSYDVGKDFDVKSLNSVKNIGDLEITQEYSEDLDIDKTF